MSTEFAWPSFGTIGADDAAGAEQARKNGYEAGYQQGLEQAAAEQRAQRAQTEQSLAALGEACAAQPDNQAAAITALAFRVLEALLRVELKSNPALIESLVAEALEELGAELAAVTIHAHPADVTWLEGICQFDIAADPTVLEGALSVRLPTVSVEFDLLGRLDELSDHPAEHHAAPNPEDADDSGNT